MLLQPAGATIISISLNSITSCSSGSSINTQSCVALNDPGLLNLPLLAGQRIIPPRSCLPQYQMIHRTALLSILYLQPPSVPASFSRFTTPTLLLHLYCAPPGDVHPSLKALALSPFPILPVPPPPGENAPDLLTGFYNPTLTTSTSRCFFWCDISHQGRVLELGLACSPLLDSSRLLMEPEPIELTLSSIIPWLLSLSDS